VSSMTAPSHGGSTGQQRPSEAPAPTRPPAQQGVKRIRISGLWVILALFAVVLVLLLVFIREKSHRVDISYFGVHGPLPLGVALLLAAVLGILLAVAWLGRGVRLRTAAHWDRKT
jgi:uncharacterized integral membrane protein